MNSKPGTDGVFFILHPFSSLLAPRPTFVRSSTIAGHVDLISAETSDVAVQVLLERIACAASDFNALLF